MKRKREEENEKTSKIRKFTPEKIEALKIIYENYKDEYKIYKRTTFTKEHLNFLSKGIEVKDEIFVRKLLKSYILYIISESKIQKKKLRTFVKNKIKNGDFLLKP